MEDQDMNNSGTFILEMENLKIVSKSRLSIEEIIRVTRERENDRIKRTLDEDYARYFGYLRELRVECKNLINSFSELIKVYQANRKSTSTYSTIQIHFSVYNENTDQIQKIIRNIRELVDKNATIHKQSGEKITGIENSWKWIEKLYPELKNPNSDMISVLEQCIGHLSSIIYECGIVTIPPRMKDHLKTLKTGYSLQFYQTFADELCSQEQSDKILTYLAEHPDYYSGIVDLKSGVIYKADAKADRWKSYLRICAAIFFGCILSVMVILVQKNSFHLPLASLITDSVPIFKLFAAVIFGALIHVVIDAFKAMKTECSSLNAVDNWLLWVHIREVQILKGIVFVCFGFVFMALTIPRDLNYFTAFLAGYSIDSLGDLFIDKFETMMAEKGAALKKTLSL